MEKKQDYYLIQKEKRMLTGKKLFSFLLEKIQPEEIEVCGEPLEVLFLPEFETIEKKGFFLKVRNKVYRLILDKKMEKLLATANREIPFLVVEACLKEFLKKECAFRRVTKVLIVDKSPIDMKEMLMPYCNNLNFVELLVDNKEDYEYLAEELYEESGLAVAFTEWGDKGPEEAKGEGLKLLEVGDMVGNKEKKKENQPELTEKYHIIIDLRKDFFVSEKNLAAGCVYFDASSSKEKERRIRRTVAGATYISPVIYLDRALKSTV